MFGWFRFWWNFWWNQGDVPAKPLQSSLNWPDEEEWVFDYDAWKWRAKEKEFNPYLHDGYSDDDDDDDEIPHAIVVADEPHECCGGACKSV